MYVKLQKIIKNAVFRPEQDLAEKVWMAVNLHEEQVLRRKRTVSLWASGASFAFLIPSVIWFMRAAGASGVGQYISLSFSGGGVLASSWKELILSIVDAVPLMSLIISLVLVFALVWSLRSAFNKKHNYSLSAA